MNSDRPSDMPAEPNLAGADPGHHDLTAIERQCRQAADWAGSARMASARSRVLEQLSAMGPRNMQFAKEAKAFRELLTGWVSSAFPFSLIRLGDGEGNALLWHLRSESTAALAELGLSRTLSRQFGRHAPAKSTWNGFADLVAESVRTATVIGLPTIKQIEGAQASLIETSLQPGDEEVHVRVRGMSGVLATWLYAANLDDAWWADPARYVVKWHVHHALLDLVPSLVKTAGSVSVVTCHPQLLEKVEQSFGVPGRESLLIPPQSSNVKGLVAECHYPDTYLKLADQIASRSRVGELHLVGAGVLGKVYCGLLRQQGAMAIDMGSMMDVWLGLSVRPNHDPAFVARHQL